MRIAWSLFFLMIAIGHFGLHIAAYNRLNSLGIPRKVIKAIDKALLVTMFLIPAAAIWFYGSALLSIIEGHTTRGLPVIVRAYGGICVAAWGLFGIPWLVWRPIFGREWIETTRKIRVVDVQAQTTQTLPLTLKANLESRLPLNQLLSLSIEEIGLGVKGMPASLDGYRIAHLSDIHLTGEIHSDYTRYVVAQAQAWKPDMMLITGDIIDNKDCIDWLFDIFSGTSAPDGCYFVLGNHDLRVPDPTRTRSAMAKLGWTDLGGLHKMITLRGVSTLIAGNEYPWFRRPQNVPQETEFRLLLSHSPDQLDWARRHNFHLMLAGHTHGGQGRLPVAGPILSPSIHGSRYASGDFYKEPTTMHVSRGLSGTHLLRINCRPELSLLTLQSAV